MSDAFDEKTGDKVGLFIVAGFDTCILVVTT